MKLLTSLSRRSTIWMTTFESLQLSATAPRDAPPSFPSLALPGLGLPNGSTQNTTTVIHNESWKETTEDGEVSDSGSLYDDPKPNDDVQSQGGQLASVTQAETQIKREATVDPSASLIKSPLENGEPLIAYTRRAFANMCLKIPPRMRSK